MELLKNQEEIKIAKEQFITQNNYRAKVLPASHILESWSRCKKTKLDSSGNYLPEITLQDREVTISNIKSETYYLKQLFDPFFLKLDNLFNEINSAIFFVDNNYNVFNKYGNKELLQELSDINLRFATNLSEKQIGTNAIAIASLTKKDSWVVGNEHYCTALTKYACYGRRAINNSIGVPIYTMMVTKCSNLTNATIACFEYINETYTQLFTYSLLPDTLIKNIIINQYMEDNKSALLALDSSKQIIYASEYFCKIFKIPSPNVIGNSLKNILPEMNELAPAINKKQPVSAYKMTLSSSSMKNQCFLINSTPIKYGEQHLGTVITLKDYEFLYSQLQLITKSDTYFTIDSLVGNSKKFNNLKQLIVNAANSPSNVLIIGESGTGKELIAQSLHSSGTRKNKPFISINCSAIPKELIGSELFGYVEGAFTGAKRGGSPGKFELANGGTLFLDEIADMPLDMQATLLRVLENRIVTRLGSSKSKKIDVRLITATNQDLWNLVQSKKFREDLFYRLNVIKLNAIPLRERKEDLPLLIDFFLKYFSRSFQKEVNKVSTEVMDFFCQYHWPGNVRELRNVLEMGVNFVKSSTITIDNLPSDIFTRSYDTKLQKQNDVTEFNSTSFGNTHGSNFKDYEKQQIQHLMIKHRGNKSAVARELGIARKTLYSRLNKYDIN